MQSSGPKTFQPREFAKLAGVTVRALHHYDRLGLLTPRRTSAGYRVYSAADLASLEQIVALKFIGFPLREIATLRKATSDTLAGSLRAQRLTLEGKRRLLDHAIKAIQELEALLAMGRDTDAAMFRGIIEAIEMQNNRDAWTQQYHDLVQTKIDRLRSLSPEALTELRGRWTALVGEIRSAMTEDPASHRAQELGSRWTGMLDTLMGKPVSPVELERHHTSQAWTPQMAQFVDKPVWDFMTRVLAARRPSDAV